MKLSPRPIHLMIHGSIPMYVRISNSGTTSSIGKSALTMNVTDPLSGSAHQPKANEIPLSATETSHVKPFAASCTAIRPHSKLVKSHAIRRLRTTIIPTDAQSIFLRSWENTQPSPMNNSKPNILIARYIEVYFLLCTMMEVSEGCSLLMQ